MKGALTVGVVLVLAGSIAALVQDLGDQMADTGSVRGGKVYGDWPGLREEQRHDGRDLRVTTDFRDVFGEVVVRHLGATETLAGQVFPGYGIKPENFRNLMKS